MNSDEKANLKLPVIAALIFGIVAVVTLFMPSLYCYGQEDIINFSGLNIALGTPVQTDITADIAAQMPGERGCLNM